MSALKGEKKENAPTKVFEQLTREITKNNKKNDDAPGTTVSDTAVPAPNTHKPTKIPKLIPRTTKTSPADYQPLRNPAPRSTLKTDAWKTCTAKNQPSITTAFKETNRGLTNDPITVKITKQRLDWKSAMDVKIKQSNTYVTGTGTPDQTPITFRSPEFARSKVSNRTSVFHCKNDKNAPDNKINKFKHKHFIRQLSMSRV